MLWATRPGPGLSPDSLKYLLLARSLAEGDGFSLFGEPHCHFPPGFPALLAAVGAVDRASLARAAWLNALLFAVNIGLAARWATKAAGNTEAGLAVAALLACSPAAVALHAMVWSEPMFLALMSGAALLAEAAARGRPRASIGCGLCLGAAVLTRHAGAALVPAVLFVIVIASRRRPWPSRLAPAAVVGLLGVAPAVAWALRSLDVAGSVAARPVELHPLDVGHARQLAGSMSALWGLGENTALGVLLLLGTAAAAGWRRREPAVALAASSAVAYVLLLVVSLCLFDADTPLDTRLLSPLFVLALVIAAPAMTRWPRAGRGIAAGLVLAGLAQTIPQVRRQAVESEGFNHRYWRSSATLGALGALAGGTRVHTNAPEWVAFETRLETSDIPTHHSRVSLQADRGYAAALRSLCATLAGDRVLALFDGVGWRWEAPTFEDIQSACGLGAPARFDDGVLYPPVTAPPSGRPGAFTPSR